MFNTPGHGMWVQFKLPEAAAKLAEEAGTYKTRQNMFCGIYQAVAKTVEGIVVLPPRVVLVGEDGANVKMLIKPVWKVVEPWVLLPPVEAQVLTLFADDGCIGVADSLVPIDFKEDIPKPRRPEIHPKDMRKPLYSPWEIAQKRLAAQQGNKSQGVEVKNDGEEGDNQHPATQATDEGGNKTGDEGSGKDQREDSSVDQEASQPEQQKIEEAKESGEPVQVRQPDNPPKNPEVALNTGKKMKRG